MRSEERYHFFLIYSRSPKGVTGSFSVAGLDKYQPPFLIRSHKHGLDLLFSARQIGEIAAGRVYGSPVKSIPVYDEPFSLLYIGYTTRHLIYIARSPVLVQRRQASYYYYLPVVMAVSEYSK